MTALAVEQRLPQNKLSRERVRRLLGVSEQRLRSWESINLVARFDAYSFADLARLRKISDLSSGHISARRLKKLIAVLAKRECVTDPLVDLHMSADEYGVVHVEIAGQTSLAKSGQILLNFNGRPRAVGATVAFPSAPPVVDDGSKKRRAAEECFERGLVLEQKGAAESEVRAAYEQAVALDPKSTGALVNLGTLFFNGRAHKKAESCYKRAIEVDPNYALAHFNLGNLYDERGDPENAFHHYLEALRLNPAYPDVHYNLALLYQTRGQSMQALTHWKTYLRLDPRSHWSEIARRELGKLKSAAIVK